LHFETRFQKLAFTGPQDIVIVYMNNQNTLNV